MNRSLHISEQLPIDPVLPELERTIASSRYAVLHAPPGAGKTTRVPPALMDLPELGGGRIVMLEPRRLAAVYAAHRMASSLGEEAGGTDGYSEKATYCLDAKTGEVIWETKADEGIGDWRCSPAYAHGLLFVGRTENMNYTALLALNAGTGEPVWSYPGGGSSPAVAGGVAYTIGQGRVYAIGQGGDAQ